MAGARPPGCQTARRVARWGRRRRCIEIGRRYSTRRASQGEMLGWGNSEAVVRETLMSEIITYDARAMNDDQLRLVATLLCEIWPKPGRTVETRIARMKQLAHAYAGPEHTAPRSYLIFDGSRLLAHAALVCRHIVTASGKQTVAGLAQVCTDPEARGQGLGERIVRAAFAPVDAGDFSLALFQTTEQVQPFYERLGARRVSNRFVNSTGDDPEADAFWENVQMIYPGDAPWPAGVVDLQGPGY